MKRLITPGGYKVAHGDHNLQEAHLEILDDRILKWSRGEPCALGWVLLPEGVPPLPSLLWGPDAGDPPIHDNGDGYVFYGRRGGRTMPSRLIREDPRPCRGMAYVLSYDRHRSSPVPIVVTAYGSPLLAPREWWDTSIRSPQERHASFLFWSVHALAAGKK